jgi:hypothetical protein
MPASDETIARAHVLTAAQRSGLEKAVAGHPDDVLAAAEAAAKARAAFGLPEDPAAEPWPPMRVQGRP